MRQPPDRHRPLRDPPQGKQERGRPGRLCGEADEARPRQQGKPEQQRQRQHNLDGDDESVHGAAPGKLMSVTSAMKKGK